MFCNDERIGNPTFALDGVCDDGGDNAVYDNCQLGTDCTDCGRRFQFPPSPPPVPPIAPPPPPPTPPPPLQLFGDDADSAGSSGDGSGGGSAGGVDGDGNTDEEFQMVEVGTELKAYETTDQSSASEIVKASGQVFAAAVDGLMPTSSEPTRLLDWELVPVSFLNVHCRFGRKLDDGSACLPLSPSAGDSWQIDVKASIPRQMDPPTYSGVSYASDYMVHKVAETPNLPWYGYPLGSGQYGIWARSPSRLISHAGYLLSFHGGYPTAASEEFGSCPLQLTYLRPGGQLWRAAPPPFAECCQGQPLIVGCLPSWLQLAIGNATVLHAPGVLYDPDGAIPDRDGNRTMHFALYYSTQPSSNSAGGLACIGRASGRWLQADDSCMPTIYWEDDEKPVLCSNSAANIQVGAEMIADVSAGPLFNSTEAWRLGSNGEALAYGAEPYYGFDGSVYLAYGARDPGNIKIVQLNESSGRLPKVAQPGSANFSANAYYFAASGPNFELGADTPAPVTTRPAYLTGKIKPVTDSASLVQNAFVWPRLKNATKEYYLFVEWFGDDTTEAAENETMLSRIYVGRSIGSPMGPFFDRIGNNLKSRYEVVLGDARTISIVSAVWGANCDGVGHDISPVAKLKCEGKTTCDWLLKYEVCFSPPIIHLFSS